MKIRISSEQLSDGKWYPTGFEQNGAVITPIDPADLSFNTKEEADTFLKNQYKDIVGCVIEIV